MSREDRYESRGNRYDRAGPNAGSNNQNTSYSTGAGGGGRYAARGRDQDSDAYDADRRRRRYERHDDAPMRHDVMQGGYGPHDGYNQPWGAAQGQGGYYPQPQQQPQAILTPEQIVALIQQQQQMGGSAPQLPTPSAPAVPAAPAPATRASAAVENFVPQIPRALMTAARSAASKGDNRLTVNDLSRGKVVLDENGFPVYVRDPLAEGDDAFGEDEGDTTGDGAQAAGASGQAQDMVTNKEGVLVLMEAPKIALAIEQAGREARRLHISGFPRLTTEEELMEYFHLLMPDVRRLMTQREMADLAKASGLDDSEMRSIPPNANTGVDIVRDIRVTHAKSRDFAFIELSLGDIVTEMVDSAAADPDRFQFPAADGHTYPLVMRRPRDFEMLPGVDETKVVMVGFPPALSEDRLRKVAEQHGRVEKFQSKEGFAYMEFTSLKEALAFRTAMHGQVLASRMVIALPLYDWLKVLCHQIGIDVTIDDDDPISGQAMLKKLTGAGGDGSSIQTTSAGASSGTAAGSQALVPSSTAAGGSLVVSAESRAIDHMRELTGMETTVPIAVFHLWQTYPHLRPLYGNQQVAVFPTRILVLLNLFDEDELVYDDTYSKLVQDIEEEVERYGRVVELIVPRRKAKPQAPAIPVRGDFDTQEEEDAAFAEYDTKKKAFNEAFNAYLMALSHPVHSAFGSVFVEYQTVDEAAHAQQQIAGKLFGGRTVITSFLFEDVLHEEEAATDEEGEKEDDGSDTSDDEDGSRGDKDAEEAKGETNTEDPAPEASVDDLLEGLD